MTDKLRLTIELETGNDAFEHQTPEAIMADALLQVRSHLSVGYRGSLRDVNGNSVGEWSLEKTG